jgi:ShK domain-like
MLRSCRKSCETCNIIDEMELSALIARKLALYEVGGDESLLETPYGITQIIDESSKSQIMEVISNFTSYMENIVFKDPSYKDVKKTCRNREGNCAFWASLGECEKVSILTVHSLLILFLL